MRIEEEIDEQCLDGGCIGSDLAIAGGRGFAEFQAVERALASQRRAIAPAGFELAGKHRHHRVVAQFVMLDQILVTQRDADDPLHHQRLYAVLDELAVAAVLEAGSETAGQSDDAISGTQQQGTGVGADAAAVE